MREQEVLNILLTTFDITLDPTIDGKRSLFTTVNDRGLSSFEAIWLLQYLSREYRIPISDFRECLHDGLTYNALVKVICKN